MTSRNPFPLAAGTPIDAHALRSLWRDRMLDDAAPSKVIELSAAVRANVCAKDLVYFGGSLARPNAALFELIRQFHGTSPSLTIIAPALAQQHALLVHSGLVVRAISSLRGNTYPAPGPNRVFGEAERAGTVEFEDWTMLTLVLRLYAAATNVPFLPTRSLVGSDLAKTLTDKGLLRESDDPFGDAGTVALVPPLHPDVTFLHCLMADEAGNAVISAPYYEDVWAAFASRRAVVLTAERIVSTAEVKKHASLVRVPGAFVTAVSEVPFGSHPNQLPRAHTDSAGGYADDYEFLDELRVACRDPKVLDDWIEEWVLGTHDHKGYLSRLGADRLARLAGKTAGSGWEQELGLLDDRWSDSASDGELVSALGGRYLEELITAEGLRSGLAGVGVSTIAAWLAAANVKAAGRAFDLMAEGGMFGYTPLPMDPYLFNTRNLYTASSLSNAQTVLDVFAGGFNSRCVGVLGAAEVDRFGSINTSRVKGRQLTGSGGGNDIASTAAAVVVTTMHSKSRLPETVEYVTSPGHRVRAIVTDRGVLERKTADQSFVLTGVLDRDGLTKEALVREAVDRCGWALAVAREVALLPAIDANELAAVRVFDPAGHFVL